MSVAQPVGQLPKTAGMAGLVLHSERYSLYRLLKLREGDDQWILGADGKINDYRKKICKVAFRSHRPKVSGKTNRSAVGDDRNYISSIWFCLYY